MRSMQCNVEFRYQLSISSKLVLKFHVALHALQMLQRLKSIR
jgi:hypothetical protein